MSGGIPGFETTTKPLLSFHFWDLFVRAGGAGRGTVDEITLLPLKGNYASEVFSIYLRLNCYRDILL